MIGPEQIIKLQSLQSKGFDQEKETFPEAIGLSEEDFGFLIKLVEQVEDESKTWSEAFEKIVELSKYASDDVVKGVLFFHLGAMYGKRATLRLIEEAEKTKFADGYKQGFSEGFKEGVEKSFEYADKLEESYKKHLFEAGFKAGVDKSMEILKQMQKITPMLEQLENLTQKLESIQKNKPEEEGD